MDFNRLEIVDDKGRYGSVSAELVELASQIVREFEAQRQGFAPDGKRFAPVGQKHALHFYRAAQLCQELGMTAPEYVSVALEHMAGTGVFWPNAIANKDPFADNENRTRERSMVSLRSYTAQLDLFEARVRLFGPELTLEDETNDFTPLFRCVMARRHRLDRVESKYALAAILELDATPVAHEAFAGELEFLDDWRSRYTHFNPFQQ